MMQFEDGPRRKNEDVCSVCVLHVKRLKQEIGPHKTDE